MNRKQAGDVTSPECSLKRLVSLIARWQGESKLAKQLSEEFCDDVDYGFEAGRCETFRFCAEQLEAALQAGNEANESSSATTWRWRGGCVSCRRDSFEAFAAALG